jgi:hypothetical protein
LHNNANISLFNDIVIVIIYVMATCALCAGDTALPRTLPQPPPQPAQRSGIVIGLSNNAGRFEDDLSTAAARPAAPRAFSLPAARTSGGGGGGIVIGSTGRRRRFAFYH